MKLSMPNIKLKTPDSSTKVVLHSCCAPCSSAIIEALVNNNITPIIYFYNPNIYPEAEYEKRKDEIIAYAKRLNIEFVDGDYNYTLWSKCVAGYEDAPERGSRCLECFKMRLIATAKFAKEHSISTFTTTLASSRWKDLNQICKAATIAEDTVEGVTFWTQNWRKGGLYERRNQLLKTENFYNQQYCGCQFSIRK